MASSTTLVSAGQSLYLRADVEVLIASCSFNVDALAGKLSTDQLSTLKQIYTEYWENGTYVFGSYYPGGEAGYPGGLVGSTPFQLGLNYFQYFVTK